MSAAKTKGGRTICSAPGLDSLRYVGFKKHPVLLELLPNVYHYACSSDVPVQCFFSILHELYKGKGSSNSPTSYRDVLLANTSGRSFLKHVRLLCAPYMHSYMLDAMCGGFMSRGIDFCSHFLKSLNSIAKANGMSSFTFLADMHTAFAAALRPLIVGNAVPDEYVAKVFHNLNISSSMFQEFAVYVEMLVPWSKLVSLQIFKVLLSFLGVLRFSLFLVVMMLLNISKDLVLGLPWPTSCFPF